MQSLQAALDAAEWVCQQHGSSGLCMQLDRPKGIRLGGKHLAAAHMPPGRLAGASGLSAATSGCLKWQGAKLTAHSQVSDCR